MRMIESKDSRHLPSPLVKADGSSSSTARVDQSRVKLETKDDVMIVGSKEGTPRHHVGAHFPPPSSVGLSHFLPHSLPPHSLASPSIAGTTTSPLDRSRILAGPAYPPQPHGPPLGPWPDPFRDPYRAAAAAGAIHDTLRAHDLAARDSLLVGRDPLREQLSIERAREDHFLRANPLGSLILNERYREQQARELIDRERQLAAAAALPPGLYPPSSLLGGPSSPASRMALSMKPGAPLPPSHHALHGLHAPPGLGSLHPGVTSAHLGAPGLPPPLVPPSLRGTAPSAMPRPPDKKEAPR